VTVVAGLLYAVLYVLAKPPGGRAGFAPSGKKHAAGWISGALIGYAITAFTLWAVIKIGLAGALGFSAAWLIVTAAMWLWLGRRISAPLVRLPTWTRRDTLALVVTLALVPILVAPAFNNVGKTDAGGRQMYRAYFTADVLWHAALTNELARFEMPPLFMRLIGTGMELGDVMDQVTGMLACDVFFGS